jgi:hypothetical protein
MITTQRRSGFDPSSFYMGSVENEVALGLFFEYFYFLPIIIPPTAPHSFYHRYYVDSIFTATLK